MKYNAGDRIYVGQRAGVVRATVERVSPTGQVAYKCDNGETGRALANGRVIASGYYHTIHNNAERGEREVWIGEINGEMQRARNTLRERGEKLVGIWQMSGRSDDKGAEVETIGRDVVALGIRMAELNARREKVMNELREVKE